MRLGEGFANRQHSTVAAGRLGTVIMLAQQVFLDTIGPLGTVNCSLLMVYAGLAATSWVVWRDCVGDS